MRGRTASHEAEVSACGGVLHAQLAVGEWPRGDAVERQKARVQRRIRDPVDRVPGHRVPAPPQQARRVRPLALHSTKEDAGGTVQVWWTSKEDVRKRSD